MIFIFKIIIFCINKQIVINYKNNCQYYKLANYQLNTINKINFKLLKIIF